MGGCTVSVPCAVLCPGGWLRYASRTLYSHAAVFVWVSAPGWQQCEGAGDGADGREVSLAKRRHTPKWSLDREAVIPQAIMKCKFQEKLFFITAEELKLKATFNLSNTYWRTTSSCVRYTQAVPDYWGKQRLECRQICMCCTVCSWFVALACGKDECFWWLKSAETMLHFAHSWSLWDGPVSLSAVAQATVHT